MSINIKSEEEKIKEQKLKEGIENVKKKYKKRWNIKEKEKFHTRDTKGGINFPKSLDEVAIGEEWEDASGKKWKRTGKNTWNQISKLELYRPDVCFSCERMLSNRNEINVNMETGKCFKCHAKEEKKKIIEGKPYEPPHWRKDIRILDSFGNTVMNIQEYIEEYGDLNAYIFLMNLKKGLDEKREKGIKVNEYMYNYALQLMGEIEERRKEDVEILNDIISKFRDQGIIKNMILHEEVALITEEFHKQKGNAKELEIIRQKKKDYKKYI